MFSLIVNLNEWDDSGTSDMPASRVLEYTEEHLKQGFYEAGELQTEKLLRLPSLFVQETSDSGGQYARVGKVTHFKRQGHRIKIHYECDINVPPIPNDILESAALTLDINSSEFIRSHWAVKDVNMYEHLIRILPRERCQPVVFNILDVETVDPKQIAVMMPFDAKFDKIYERIVSTVGNSSYQCRRADDIWKNPAIIQDVVSLIDASRAVIVDCSDRNPNVFYELGIAHTLGREVILITQSASDIPFDIGHLRYIRYFNSDEGLTKLCSDLQNRLEQITN